MIEQSELYSLYHQLEALINDPSTEKEQLRGIAIELANEVGRMIDQRESESLSLANLLDSCLDTNPRHKDDL